MIITAYSTRHRGYTAYRYPLGFSLTFVQITGYHSKPQDAVDFAKQYPGEMVNSTRVHDSISIKLPNTGTVTGRLSKRDPKFQDPIHEGFTRRPIVSADYSAIEQRVAAHYMQEPDSFARFAAHVEGYGMPDTDEVAEDVFAANAERELLDQRKPASGRRKGPEMRERAAQPKNESQRAPK